MNELILCGNGGLLQYVKQQAEHISTHPIHSVIEDVSDLSTDFSSLFSRSQLSETTILLAVSWHETERWIKQLKAAGAKRIYRIPVFAMQYDLPILKPDGIPYEYCARISEDDSDLLYLETHVADTCNLKCRGCMHFSNIAIHPNFPDLREFDRDFRRLAELFSNIFIIRLMGGEPLLNRELCNGIKIARHHFPAAELRIVTNGLLIPRQPDELWEVMRECHAAMDISPYPPTIKIIDKLTAKLDAEHIPYGTIASELRDFRKSLTLTPSHDPGKAVQLCQSSHCHFLRNGKIAKCPLPLLICDFNTAYNFSIPSEDIFDIYTETSGTELRKKLERYANMCRYCPDKAAFIPWQKTDHNACMEDWIVEEKIVEEKEH